jgi:lipid-A-disaccharide synthase
MYHADFGFLKSGTCNLEAAFCGLPFACFYKAAPLTAWIVRRFIKISEVSLVNIVRPQTVREFLQVEYQAPALLEYLRMLWEDPGQLQQLKDNLQLVRSAFASGGVAATKVAQRVRALCLSESKFYD